MRFSASKIFLILVYNFCQTQPAWPPPALAQQLEAASTPLNSDFDGATFYKATEGSQVRLACKASQWNEHSVSLVLWFKGSPDERLAAPIYTVDARQRPLGQARHLVAEAYRDRARFVARASPPYLELSKLEAADQAEYRCRVDYRTRPRENLLVILFVLGRPAASLSWRHEGQVIDGTYLSLADFVALRRRKQLAPLVDGHQAQFEVAPARQAGLDQDGAIAEPEPAGSEHELDWLSSSAEFRYYERELGSLDVAGRASLKAGKRAPSAKQASQQLGDHQRPHSASADWLSLGRDEESVINSVNILQVSVSSLLQLTGYSSNLNNANSSFERIKLANELPASANKSSTRASAISTGLLAKLECEASNLHYDLHSLLRLYAPPSLFSRLQAPAFELATIGDAEPQASEFIEPPSPTGRLVAAASRALELSVRADLLGLLPLGGHHQQSRQLQLNRNTSSSSRSSSSSLSADSKTSALGGQQSDGGQDDTELSPANDDSEPAIVATASLLATGWQQQPSRPASGQSEQLELAKLVGQQVARVHRLALAHQFGQQANSSPSAPSLQALTGWIQVSRPIQVEIYVRPSEVRIAPPATAGQQLSAGQLAEFVCTVVGSRPAARIIWLKNGHQLESKLSRQIDEPSGALSHSRLTLKLRPQDHQAKLACRAQNEYLSKLTALGGRLAPSVNSSSATSLPVSSLHDQVQLDASHDQGQPALTVPLEDSRTLSVQYLPKVKLELGQRILSSAIREGADVYFECQVDAYPSAREITWLHNGKPINESLGSQQQQQQHQLHLQSQTSELLAGQQTVEPVGGSGLVIISNNSLVLQRVKVEQRGRYACVAANSEGATESNRIELRVLHAPLCVVGGDERASQQVQVAPDSTASSFLCEMDADPNEVEFTWWLNYGQPNARILFRGQSESGKQNASGAVASNNMDGSANKQQKQQLQAQHQKQPQSRSSGHTGIGSALVTGQSLASSTLSYKARSAADFGELQCFARNSIGEQRRSCSYSIGSSSTASDQPAAPGEQGGNQLAANESRQQLAEQQCLVANVTGQSVVIGCSRRPDHFGPYHFALELLELASHNKNTSGNSSRQQGEATIRLTTGPLEDPLFSVGKLWPATSYELRVHSLDYKDQTPNMVTFTTSSVASMTLQREPSTKLVASDQADEPNVVSAQGFARGGTDGIWPAVISTRSAAASASASGSGETSQYNQLADEQQQVAASEAPRGWFRSLLEGPRRASPTSSRFQAVAAKQNSLRTVLLEPPVMLACLVALAVSLVGVLLAFTRHRHCMPWSARSRDAVSFKQTEVKQPPHQAEGSLELSWSPASPKSSASQPVTENSGERDNKNATKPQKQQQQQFESKITSSGSDNYSSQNESGPALQVSCSQSSQSEASHQQHQSQHRSGLSHELSPISYEAPAVRHLKPSELADFSQQHLGSLARGQPTSKVALGVSRSRSTLSFMSSSNCDQLTDSRNFLACSYKDQQQQPSLVATAAAFKASDRYATDNTRQPKGHRPCVQFNDLGGLPLPALISNANFATALAAATGCHELKPQRACQALNQCCELASPFDYESAAFVSPSSALLSSNSSTSITTAASQADHTNNRSQQLQLRDEAQARAQQKPASLQQVHFSPLGYLGGPSASDQQLACPASAAILFEPADHHQDDHHHHQHHQSQLQAQPMRPGRPGRPSSRQQHSLDGSGSSSNVGLHCPTSQLLVAPPPLQQAGCSSDASQVCPNRCTIFADKTNFIRPQGQRRDSQQDESQSAQRPSWLQLNADCRPQANGNDTREIICLTTGRPRCPASWLGLASNSNPDWNSAGPSDQVYVLQAPDQAECVGQTTAAGLLNCN